MTSQLISAIMLGGYYAILATGLAFMYSVMGIINLAHGALIIAAAYGLYVIGGLIGVPFAIVVMVVVMFVVGFLLHRFVLSRATKGGALLPLLSTFGIAIVLENLLFQTFGADSHSLAPLVGDLSWASFELPNNIFVGKVSVYTLGAAIGLISALEFMLRRTTLGHCIQATSQDRATASLLGIDTARTAAIATGIALATGVFAATALGLRTAWAPYAGSAQLLFAFEAVVIGGMGSLWRVFWGAMILAIAQSLAAMVHPQGFLIGGHLAFLIAIFMRLRGGAFGVAAIRGKGARA